MSNALTPPPIAAAEQSASRIDVDELVRRAHDNGADLTVGDIDFFERGLSARMPGTPWLGWLVDDVVFHNHGVFDFSRDLRQQDGSVRAYTLVVRDVGGHDADILAWNPRLQLSALWRNAVCCIGEEQIDAPRLEPLVVHESIPRWLAADRRGIIISHAQAAARLLSGYSLAALSPRLLKQLRRDLIVTPPRISLLNGGAE